MGAAVGGFVEAGEMAGAAGHGPCGAGVEGPDGAEVEFGCAGWDGAGAPVAAAVESAQDGAVGSAGPGDFAADGVDAAEAGDTVAIVLNQTPFYGESGGQIGDTGKLTTLKGFEGEVEDTSKPLGRLHVLRTKVLKGELTVGETIHQAVDADRRDRVRANHSATHLLHAALRHRLGTHVTQKGSLVAPDRFRFDFSHPSALTPQEIADVEADVNAQVRGNGAVTTLLMTPDDAIAMGAMALFGEKYGDEVRVVSMGSTNEGTYSIELCGGTHCRASGQIGGFVITGNGTVASPVRNLLSDGIRNAASGTAVVTSTIENNVIAATHTATAGGSIFGINAFAGTAAAGAGWASGAGLAGAGAASGDAGASRCSR